MRDVETRERALAAAEGDLAQQRKDLVVRGHPWWRRRRWSAAAAARAFSSPARLVLCLLLSGAVGLQLEHARTMTELQDASRRLQEDMAHAVALERSKTGDAMAAVQKVTEDKNAAEARAKKVCTARFSLTPALAPAGVRIGPPDPTSPRRSSSWTLRGTAARRGRRPRRSCKERWRT